MSDLISMPYKPDTAKCCEACVFGTGAHADWCRAGSKFVLAMDRVLRQEGIEFPSIDPFILGVYPDPLAFQESLEFPKEIQYTCRVTALRQAKSCLGADPLCPCQDGDHCHYEATARTPRHGRCIPSLTDG